MVGIDDEGKTQSEDVTGLFRGGTVVYKAGGHQVGRELRNDAYLCNSLRGFIRANGQPREFGLSTLQTLNT